MSGTRNIAFADTFVERGTTEDGIEWGLQPSNAGDPSTTSIVDEAPYYGAVHIPEGHPFLGEDGKELMLSVFSEEDADRLHRGKDEAVGWLGISYAGMLDSYDDAEADPFMAMLAKMAGMTQRTWTRESVIEDIKRIAGIISANK